MRARDILGEKWSKKYKRSIDCSRPKGFSQRAHCAGRKKNESINEAAVTFAGQDPNKFTSPRGGKPVMVVVTDQGSRYLITSDGMVLRHKSAHANTGGEDAGMQAWSDKIEFYDRSKPLVPGMMQGLAFPDAVTYLFDKGRIALSKGQNGERVALIAVNGTWRPATIADAMPKAVASKPEWGKIVIKADAGTWGLQPKLGWQPLDYNMRTDGTLNRVHNGSPVSHGAPVTPAAVIENESTSGDRIDYVIYVNDKPATVYDTREQAQRDLDLVREKYPHKKFEIKRRHRHEEIGEDAGSSPGGVSPNTKMVCEKDDLKPYIKAWRDRNGIKHWEVYDWRNAFQKRFSSKQAAQEWLDAHWDKLSEGVDISKPKWQLHQTARQRVGIKNWHEIDRAYSHKNAKNPDDPLLNAKLKYADETVEVLSRENTVAVWNFLKAFFRDPNNQRNQRQVYDALSTPRGIQQILAMSRAHVRESKDVSHLKRTPTPQRDFIFRTSELSNRGIVRTEEQFNSVGMYWYERLRAYAIPWWTIASGGEERAQQIERVIARRFTPQENAKIIELRQKSSKRNRDAALRAAHDGDIT